MGTTGESAVTQPNHHGVFLYVSAVFRVVTPQKQNKNNINFFLSGRDHSAHRGTGSGSKHQRQEHFIHCCALKTMFIKLALKQQMQPDPGVTL